MKESSTLQDPVVGTWHGWLGLLLIAVFWPLNWLVPGLRTHLFFGPLWLGYILAVDALVLHRRGTSILTRSPKDFALLFLFSAPAWWLFEVLNWRTGNWQYLGRERFGDLTFFLLASVSFTTVMPAVFGTAELVRGFRWMERLRHGPRLPRSLPVCLGLLLLGMTMLALLLLWPAYFYLFLWGSVFCILEPINVWLGRRSLLDYLQHGDWRPVLSLALGALICGFFWELWNYYAYPKWTYYTPGVGFLYIFEMPLIGFIGYLPFGLELYALFNLIQGRDFRLNL